MSFNMPQRLRAAVVLCAFFFSGHVLADNVVADDQIVQGSLCVGFDCVDNESFGFDTLRLKENNLRIHFEDTSSQTGFPTNDWSIAANDSYSGGANYFMIQDRGGSGNDMTSVFRIDAGAQGGVAIGYGATTSGADTVSIGATGDERRITHLAAATSGTDAVNLDQMNAALAVAAGASSAYADAGDAAALDAARAHADTGDVATLAAAQAHADTGDAATLDAARAHADTGDATTLGTARIHADAGDAATLQSANSYSDTRSAATLNSARAYTDSRLEQMQHDYHQFERDVWDRFDRTDDRIDRMGALTTAMAQMTANASGGRSERGRIAVGAGFQNGKEAVSVGYGRSIGQRASLSLGAAFSGSDTSAGVGFGLDL